MRVAPRAVPVSPSNGRQVTEYGFPGRVRLLKTDEFSSVFSFRRRIYGQWLTLYGLPNTLGHARIGIVVSKKTARRAVSRNYMRRVIREWFRLHRHLLPAQDLVIRINKCFSRQDGVALQEELARLSNKLEMRKADVSANPA